MYFEMHIIMTKKNVLDILSMLVAFIYFLMLCTIVYAICTMHYGLDCNDKGMYNVVLKFLSYIKFFLNFLFS